MRLQKYLALCGVASRRRAEELIASGRVEVDGTVVCKQGYKVSDVSKVKVDGEPVRLCKRKYYIMLNKPPGFVTTSRDQFGRRTVLDLVRGYDARLYPVGRLDYETSGLLLLTNDGEFAQMLTHPSFLIPKVYMAKVAGIPDNDDIAILCSGILLDGKLASATQVEVTGTEHSNDSKRCSSTVSMTVCEGRNRIIRKMLERAGHPVLSLQRTQIGTVCMGDLKPGSYRELTADEIRNICPHHEAGSSVNQEVESPHRL